MNERRSPWTGIVRRLETQAELTLFAEVAAVDRRPSHAGNALLEKDLRGFQLSGNARQECKEVLADREHRETAAGMQSGLTGGTADDDSDLRIGIRLRHLVGGGDGRIEGASEGERQCAEDGFQFHEVGYLVWFGIHRLPSAYSDQSVN